MSWLHTCLFEITICYPADQMLTPRIYKHTLWIANVDLVYSHMMT